MKLLIGLILSAVVCTPGFAQKGSGRTVVVISLDGFPGFAFDDPKLPIPTLRRLMLNGAHARMTTVNPTVTWPNHTTMVTGVRADQHGLIANGTITPTGAWPPVKVDPLPDKERMVHVPTVYDAVSRAGMTTAQVDWVAINHAPTINWAFSEWASADGPLESEMIRKGVIQASDVDKFEKSNILFRDQIWATAAVHLIKEHHPNLLLLHFLTLDSVHHRFGPNTLAALSAMAFLDGCVARVVDAINAAGMADRTTFIIVSDHGFKRYTKEIRPVIALTDVGLDRKVYVLPEGGSAYVYFDRMQAAELGPKVRGLFENIEGIDKVIGPEGFAALGLALPGGDRQMYQMLLTAKDGYAFAGAKGGPVTAALPQQEGGHGYLASDPDMDAIFIASGAGVRPGNNLDRIANTEIAPTIAKLLGVSLPTAKGKGLVEQLR